MWRDRSSSGLAAWGNTTLNARVLDLLADIVFAADEIRDMVEIEHGFPSFDGFADALARISTDADGLIQQLGNGRGATARDVTSGDSYARDPEIAELLAAIAQRLNALEPIQGPEHEEALELVEAYASRYALALFYEISRLDALVERLRIEPLAEAENPTGI